ncbi:MAG: YDG domain-containing protein, partial [Bacteroidota bacterium]
MNTNLSKLMSTSFKRTKHTTTKLFSLLALLLMLGVNGVMGQTNIFNFNFDSGSSPSTNNTLSGTPTFLKIGTFSSSATTACNGAGGIQDAAWDAGDAYQFKCNTTGFSNLVFSFNERTSNISISSFIVRASSDSSSWSTIKTTYTPTTACASSGSLALPSTLSNQSVIYIQIYKSVSAGNSGNNYRIDDALLTGTSQATTITTGTITSSSIPTISCTIGTGAKRAIFMAASTSGAAAPVNATTYIATTDWNNKSNVGNQIGSTGWYCIFNGTGTPSVTVTNLSGSTTYRIMVCEYDGASAAEVYNTYSSGTNNPKNQTTTSSSTNFFWNGAASGGTGAATGGTGTWNTSNTNWISPTNDASGTGVVWGNSATSIANINNGTGTITIPSSLTANFTIIGTTGYTIATSGSSPITLSGGLTLSNGLSIAPITAAPFSLTGAISGSGLLTLNGLGATTLSGTNINTGGVTLSNGTLNINSASALGTTAGTFVINGGTIDNTSGGNITTSNYPQTWGADFAFTGSNALNLGTGAVALGSSASRTVTANASTLTIGGIISGSSSSLTKAGSGTLSLSGANTFNGGLNINAGTVSLAASNVLADAGAVTINGGILNSAGAFTDSISTLTLTSGSITGSTGTLNPFSISVSSGTIDAILGGGAAAMTKNTSGTVFLTNGSNTYAGGTTINGGILSVNGANRLGGTAVGVTINAGTFQLTTTSITSARAFNFNNSASTFDVASGISYTNTTATYTGSGILNKTGSGTLTFQTSNANAQTYNGLSIKGGIVSIGKETDLGSVPGSTNASYLLLDGGTLLDSNTITIDSKRGIVLGTGGGTINVLSTKTVTYGGIIADNSGAGSLTKTGSGILTLTGTANSYTGSTTITTGELRLNPSANATFASQIVLNGGTLSTTSITGTRTFTSSSTLNLNANSTLALGSNAHTITFANSSAVTWAGSTLTVTGWTGTAGSSGTAGQIFVGAGGLDASQLAKINFSGYANGAMIVAGELVPYVSSSPTISGAATTTAFTATYGTVSAVQTFSISGINLTDNITATAPTGFEVSSDGTTFGTTATFTQSGGNASGSLRIRLAANAAVTGSYNSLNIVLSATGASNVNITTPASGNNVSAATLTISGLSASAKAYDGTTTVSVTVGTLVFVGLQNGDAATVTGSPTYAFATAGAGTAKAISQTGSYGASFTSGVIGNYTITQPSLTANITAVALTITGLTGVNKVYDATTTATTTGTATYVGLVNGESFTVSGTPVRNFADANVGTAKTITITGYTAPSANYTVSQPAGLTADILKANQTITFGALAAKTTASADFAPGATSPTSGVNAISYTSSNLSVATIVSNQIRIIGAGTTNITASQASSANYNAATDVVQSLTVTSAPVALAGWDFSNIATTDNFGASPYTVTTNDANVTVGGLTRGSGFGAMSTNGVASAWGSNNFTTSGTLSGEISANKFYTFTITANSGKLVTLTSISAYNIRRSSSGPTTGQWQYQIGSGSFVNIGSAITWGGTTSSSGNAQTAIDLSGITDLSQVPSSSVITIRLVSYGATGTAGTNYLKDLGNTTSNDLIINGIISVPATPPTLTADATANTVDNNIDITFSDDATWRSKITAVKVGSTALTLSTDYVITAGNIQLIPSGTNALLTTSGSKSLTVVATGYADATLNQAINAGAPTSNSTATISAILAPNATRTVTCTAKDQYNNLVSGYTFKYDATITSNDATTAESYTIDGSAITTTANNSDVSSTTNASGVATFTVVMPATLDANDGLSLQVQLNNGSTNVGSPFTYYEL